MKSSIIALSVAALLAFGATQAATQPAHAAAPAKAMAAPPAKAAAAPVRTAQQQKMAACASANKGKKGDDYKNSVSACLKAPLATAAPTQQDKMKTCNVDATKQSLKGDARKTYMSTCLKK